MTVMHATVRGGRLVIDTPPDWPDGATVEVRVVDDDQPLPPEEIARRLAIMATFEPVEFTPQEEAEIAAWREQVKQYTLKHMNDGIEGLFP